MVQDLLVAYRKDPALRGAHTCEVILYPGIWAIWVHRVSHRLYQAGLPFLPRAISQAARVLTGVEIHPGASIGRGCFIDHASGVVIGETAELGDDVMLYQGVTLGASGWWKDAKGAKRHPTVGSHVTVGVGATILGPVQVGEGASIGAHALVLRDVPAFARVRARDAAADTGAVSPVPGNSSLPGKRALAIPLPRDLMPAVAGPSAGRPPFRARPDRTYGSTDGQPGHDPARG